MLQESRGFWDDRRRIVIRDILVYFFFYVLHDNYVYVHRPLSFLFQVIHGPVHQPATGKHPHGHRKITGNTHMAQVVGHSTIRQL